MLASLRFNGFIGGDNEQDGFNACRTREHVADEAFMAGNIYKANVLASGEGEMSKAEVDGNTAALFFG